MGTLMVGGIALSSIAQDKPTPTQPITQQKLPADAKMKAANSDNKFILKAASGGMAEVELGKLAVQKATASDVKQFGQHMIDDHSKANDELKTLAAQKQVTLPSAPDAKEKKLYNRLSKLSGAAFDKAYVHAMLTDHEEDVKEFERESNSGNDPDVKAWAAKTLPTLKDHLQMVRGLSGKSGKMNHVMEPKKP
jgi:putative membrane protein